MGRFSSAFYASFFFAASAAPPTNNGRVTGLSMTASPARCGGHPTLEEPGASDGGNHHADRLRSPEQRSITGDEDEVGLDHL